MKHNKIHIVITNRIWHWYRILTDNWIQFKKRCKLSCTYSISDVIMDATYHFSHRRYSKKTINKSSLDSNLFLSLFNYLFHFSYFLLFMCDNSLCISISGFSDFTIYNLNTSKRSICEMCQSLFFFQKQLISINWWFIQSLSLILVNQICAGIVVVVFLGSYSFLIIFQLSW